MADQIGNGKTDNFAPNFTNPTSSPLLEVICTIGVCYQSGIRQFVFSNSMPDGLNLRDILYLGLSENHIENQFLLPFKCLLLHFSKTKYKQRKREAKNSAIGLLLRFQGLKDNVYL